MTAPTVEALSVPPTWPQQPDDPFRYGWREVRRATPDGEETSERVPLTLEDVLHPQVGDFVVHTEAHERRNLYLYDVFIVRVADDPSAVVRVVIRLTHDNADRLRLADVRRILGETGATYLGSITAEVERPSRVRLPLAAGEEDDPLRMLGRWLETQPFTPDRQALLLRHAEGLLVEDREG